jgi:hypothetical protein
LGEEFVAQAVSREKLEALIVSKAANGAAIKNVPKNAIPTSRTASNNSKPHSDLLLLLGQCREPFMNTFGSLSRREPPVEAFASYVKGRLIELAMETLSIYGGRG